MEFTTIAKAKKQTGLTYLGTCGSSAKIVKNSKVLNIDTYVLYLAPWKLSGFNTCAGATKDCIKGCLNTSGRVAMEIASNNENKILNSRIMKTQLFYKEREFFLAWLIAEIAANKRKSETKGNEFSVRLNGTSDLNWTAYKYDGKNIFEHFPTVQFYDYTKIANRFNNIPVNYHLTFSYTGYNWSDCENVLNNGGNVAAVFNIQKWYNSRPENGILPIKFKGYKIIDGDITDFRPLDEKGTIVGLRWKRIANKKDESEVRNSKFVVQPDSKDCTYKMVEKKVALV